MGTGLGVMKEARAEAPHGVEGQGQMCVHRALGSTDAEAFGFKFYLKLLFC